MGFWGGSLLDMMKMYSTNNFPGDHVGCLHLTGYIKHIFIKEACEKTVENLNKKGYSLQKGGTSFGFSGTYRAKGCYAYHSGKYNGRVYWSNKGLQKQMEEAVGGDKYCLPLYTNNHV